MIHRLRRWLTEPMVRDLNPDSPEITVAHREVLRRKVILRRVFEGFYRRCYEMDSRYFGTQPGPRLEIGSGSSFIKEVLGGVWTSDIKVVPLLDLVARAERLPFGDSSIRAVYAINVFHHLPDPEALFYELLRVLRPGGGCIFIEPYHGWLARLFFRHLHASEGFDMAAPGWTTARISGPMSNANQALSYIVFTRDRARLKYMFPALEIVEQLPHTQLAYVLSGGVNFRQLVPDALVDLVIRADGALASLDRLLALQHTIVMRKRAGSPASARRGPRTLGETRVPGGHRSRP